MAYDKSSIAFGENLFSGNDGGAESKPMLILLSIIYEIRAGDLLFVWSLPPMLAGNNNTSLKQPLKLSVF
jgi:hypothetical protein